MPIVGQLQPAKTETFKFVKIKKARTKYSPYSLPAKEVTSHKHLGLACHFGTYRFHSYKS